jgi:ferredoxin--NADP+ reductase
LLNMPAIGTVGQPLRVAIVGSGPSGFYAAEHLLKQANLAVEIDMYDRLPTPYGLVRGGVAPDHQKIKGVIKVYERIAASANFRFFGNVEIGRDLMHSDLMAHYHAVIYAVGAQSDRRMGIPGEDLAGSHAATEFVGWYNAHPDYRDLQFDLSQERVAVIGNGNVAMDVVRILAKTPEELIGTDIADYALEALRHSRVKHIYMLGRRGPAQAAYTNPELKELGELADADVIVSPEEAMLDPLSAEWLDKSGDTSVQKNVRLLQEYAARGRRGKSRQIHMHFLVSPVELIGTERVEAIKLVRNVLQPASDGSLRPKATDETFIIPVGLVFRSIGYKGVALPELPFDERNGVLPNVEGRVVADGQVLRGVYCAGWIKRGPTGVIGTNKPDSVETVNQLLNDLPHLPELPAENAQREAIPNLLASRGVAYVTFSDWQLIDQLEIANGQAVGRPRLKFSRVPEMLEALAAYKRAQVSAD